jgi:hypothetical protein
MTRDRRGRFAPWLLASLLAIGLGYSSASLAKSTGVGDDAALQSGPCYQALVDRNVSQPTTAPSRELGAACDIEHGDVEKAWARVVRLWGSDSADVPDYDSYRRADDGSSASSAVWMGLGVLGMLLVYALCGTPMRSAARLMGMDGGGAPARNAAAAIVNLILRGALSLALLWLSGLPYLTLALGLGFVAIIARTLRAPAASTPTGKPTEALNGASGFACLVADAANDLLGAAPGLVGLALLAQHDARLVALAVALAVVASIPAIILARRRLRANPLAMTIAGTLLAAAIAAVAQQDATLAALAGRAGVPSLAAPLVLALAIFALSWRNLNLSRVSLKPQA